MLKCVEEINESKRFKAYFSDGTTTKFGHKTLRRARL